MAKPRPALAMAAGQPVTFEAKADTTEEITPSTSNPPPPAPAPHTRALLGASAVGWVCLILNVAWTIWAAVRHPADSNLVGVLYRGSCDRMNNLSTWLHLLINILSTALLAASNYCMQVALAPTRDEVDAAHRRGKSLAIGMPSLRNLGRTSALRNWIWAFLALGSIPLHLVFNSAIFSAISVNEYAFAVADESYLTDQELWNVNASMYLAEYDRAPFNSTTLVDDWDRLSWRECLQEYGADFVTKRRNVLVIVDGEDRELDVTFQDLPDGYPEVRDNIREHRLEGSYRYFTSGVNAAKAPKHSDWLCIGTLGSLSADTGFLTRPGSEELPASTEATGVWICNPDLIEEDGQWRIVNLPYTYPVRYCLSEPLEESCRLEYSPVILGIICAANLLKALLMTLLFFTHSRPSLLTIGDSVASFLSRPDPTTVGYCTAYKKTAIFTTSSTHQPKPQPLRMGRRRYGAVPSVSRWLLTVISAIAALGALIGLLGQGIQADAREASIQIGDLWDRGFGAVNTISLIGKGRGGNASWRQDTLAMVVLANTPQLLLSILYYSYNALFTSMCAGAEWSQFGVASERKTLRVSQPVRGQRSSYYLSLPYRFSLPLIVLSVILHWLTSQSLFLAKVDGSDSHGLQTTNYVTTCGYSNIAIIFAIISGGVALVFLLTVAAFPLKSNIPVVGSSSAAISASCHPLYTKVDVLRDAIGWGVEVAPREPGVQTPAGEAGQSILHTTLTSGETRAPVEGEVYL